jgi:cbb3-type cytochrome oxidase maturation protein
MEIIYITIPLVLVVGSLVVGVFIWMAKKGQFDDLDGAAHRILLDDEADSTPTAVQKPSQAQHDKTGLDDNSKP